jgi:hypothetical protein
MIRQGFDIKRGLRNAVFFQRAGKQSAKSTYEFVSRELPSARSERLYLRSTYSRSGIELA